MGTSYTDTVHPEGAVAADVLPGSVPLTRTVVQEQMSS